MLGDEVGNKALSVSVKVGKITGHVLLEIMKAIANEKYKVVQGKQSLKELNKKGRALENVNIDKADLKAIEKHLKKDGVDFAIKKDIDNDVFNIYFKSQDISQIEKVFKKYVDKNFKDLKKGVKEQVKEAGEKAKEHNSNISTEKKEKRFEKDRGDR